MKSDLCLNVFYYSLSWPKRSIFFRAYSTSSVCLDLIHPAASLAFNTPSLAVTLQASTFQLWEEAYIMILRENPVCMILKLSMLHMSSICFLMLNYIAQSHLL